MIDEIKRVRAHHGMCLCYYKGKGYSSDFTDNMWAALRYLQTQNPVVEIVDYDDHICASCPNLLTQEEVKAEGRTDVTIRKVCESAEKVARYDSGALKICGLESGARMHWLAYRALVQEKIIQAGRRTEICGDCEWTGLCH